MEPNLIAVSTGPGARWSWRIVTRTGRLLQESSGTFQSLTEALVDGRRHLEGEPPEVARLRDEDLTSQ